MTVNLQVNKTDVAVHETLVVMPDLAPAPKPVDQQPTTDEAVVDPSQVITFDRAAALVGRKKRTLMNWQKDDPPPDPDVAVGGGGRAHEWKYQTLRPWLVKHSGRNLPQHCPGNAS